MKKKYARKTNFKDVSYNTDTYCKIIAKNLEKMKKKQKNILKNSLNFWMTESF